MTKRLSESSGFTLVEVMVSSAILLVGVLSLMGMQMVSLTKTVDARELSLVTNLAADMIERLRFTGDMNPPITALYNGINTTNAATCNAITQAQVKGDCTQWQALVTNSNLVGIQGTVAVAAFGPAVLNANQVTVTINWNSKQGQLGRARSLTFVTVVDPK
jgi:type IV pilus assembly protein PilV